VETRINVYEAKNRLSKLLQEVEAGGRVVICRNGVPVVELVPHRSRRDRLAQNPALLGAKFHGDPMAPLDEEDWPEALR
jgi:prevent-host-death family protein